MSLATFFFLAYLVTTTQSTVFRRQFECNSPNSFECMKSIGKQSKPLIHTFLKTTSISSLLQYTKTTAGIAKLLAYKQYHVSKVPELVHDLEGLAAGANVPFDDLLAVNLQSELGFFVSGCSDVHVVNNSTSLWLHNEDGGANLQDLVFIVKAKIGESEEAFTAFAYPGQLPGWAWGVNGFGFVQSINALSSPPPNESPELELGLGVVFVARKVLKSESVEHAMVVLNETIHGGGQHFNIGSIDSIHQYSVEIAANKPPSVLKLRKNYFHANQYLHAGMYEHQPRIGDLESSIHRLSRFAMVSLNENESPEDKQLALKLMGDVFDADFPVFRSNTTADPELTHSTTVFDLLNGVVEGFSGGNMKLELTINLQEYKKKSKLSAVFYNTTKATVAGGSGGGASIFGVFLLLILGCGLGYATYSKTKKQTEYTYINQSYS